MKRLAPRPNADPSDEDLIEALMEFERQREIASHAGNLHGHAFLPLLETGVSELNAGCSDDASILSERVETVVSEVSVSLSDNTELVAPTKLLFDANEDNVLGSDHPAITGDCASPLQSSSNDTNQSAGAALPHGAAHHVSRTHSHGSTPVTPTLSGTPCLHGDVTVQTQQASLHAFFKGGPPMAVATPHSRRRCAPSADVPQHSKAKRARHENVVHTEGTAQVAGSSSSCVDESADITSAAQVSEDVLPPPRRTSTWPAVLFRRQKRVHEESQEQGAAPVVPSSWLKGLNTAQLAAATADDPALIILAGVGVGKTTTLLARVAELVHRGIKPWRLLLTSFTNKACDELRDRVGAMMPQCRRVNILTVHSLALSIVQAFHVKAGYPRPVQVLDKAPLHQLKEWWQWALLEKYRVKACGWLSVADSTGWEDLRLIAEAADPTLHDQLMNFPAPSMARQPPLVRTLHGDAQAGSNGKRQHAWRYAIARALLYHLRRIHEPKVHEYLQEKHGELKISDVLFRPPGGTLPGIRHAMATAKREKEKPEMFLAGSEFRFIYEKYVSWSTSECKVDFEDILDAAIRVAKDPEIRARLRATFDHILTDETQDKNEKQVELLELLDPPAVTLVGDPDQVIFSFAGSVPKVFQRLQTIWKHARVVPLQENYRSTAAILQAACLALVPEGEQPKAMAAAAHWRNEGGPLEIWECAEPADEAEAIAEEVERLLDAGTRASEICILLRCFSTQRGKAHDPLRKAFTSHGIPYFLIRDQSVLAGAVAQDLFAYCRLLLDPRDSDALLRTINEPPRRLGATFCDRLREVAHVQQCSLFEALPHVKAQGDAQRRVEELTSLLRSLAREARTLSPGEVLRRIVEETRYTETSSRRSKKAAAKAVDQKIAADSDSEESDDEGKDAFRGKVDAVIAEADAWSARRRKEIQSTSSATAASEQNGPPSLWSLCCKAWFALPPHSEAAIRPMTAEQGLTVDLAERESGLGLSVLSDFLDDAKLRSAAESTKDAAGEGKVQISTIHRAKGGEWDIVFSARFNEGFHPVAPTNRVLDHATGKLVEQALTGWEAERHLQEERRLAHVAFSRARRRLVVTYVRGDISGGAWQAQNISSILLPETALRAPARPATMAEWAAQSQRRAVGRNPSF